MSQQDEARRAVQDLGLNLDQDSLDRLARGEEVELPTESEAGAASASAVAADAAECCPPGWIGIGHKPRICIKPVIPPKIKICWG